MIVNEQRKHPGAGSILLRPNGQVEPLDAAHLHGGTTGYASRQPGRADPQAMQIASRADRRRRRRGPAADPLVGRLVDLKV